MPTNDEPTTDEAVTTAAPVSSDTDIAAAQAAGDTAAPEQPSTGEGTEDEAASEEESVTQVFAQQAEFDRTLLEDPTKKWYVVSAQAGQEKRAKLMLEERVKYSNLADQFGVILVPTEEVVELRGGKRRRSERRFYPGYIFVQMEMNESTWELVTKTTRISGFVGGTIAKPTPLPKAEIQLILDRIDQGGEKVTPKTVFEPGELIRIIDGPFNEFSGTVEEVNYKKQQLVVAVTIFGRSTPVELDFSQVEKG
ncbi:MAG: transcription termination/antitermination protein NusG [Gammaproteobacteria bacterium]|nr:transcription termination/antitermination protein NusG [Gammaproteobacteria bacterium]